jgi:secretion/DNA translocation related TadE-like protein
MTIWVASVITLIWLGAGVAGAYGTATVARHRAAAAADLAALAAAVHVPDGQPGACQVAAEVAARNGGRLRDCRVAGEDVEVQVVISVVLGRFGGHEAVGSARAGPVLP